ncbi:hypothetical protein V6N11_066703 [Hibiscus sabdariffa]|uniref:Uncharacterized protein n=1 Tax=Hibiscus sabdariffa TaxID=183260 RepID=A0ABR1ZYQ0_9ROSI
MWFLLWLAWCWFVTPSQSVDARCGQLRFRCHVLPGSAGVPTPLAALLVDFGDAGFRCRFPCDALWLFRSHALLISVGVSILLAALLLTDFGRRLLILSFANLLRPLAEILSRFLLPLCLCFGGLLHPLPCLAPGLGMVCFLGRFGLAPSWCTVVRAALARSLGLWRLPHPGVHCQGGSLGNLMRTRPPGCVFLLLVPPLLSPSVLGDSRSQGCATKAPCAVCLCAAKAPRAGSVCTVLGGSRNLGCTAKAHRAVYGPYAASAPCAGLCAPLALAGDLRPICGLRLP